VKNGWVTRSTEQLTELRRLLDGLDGPPGQPLALPPPPEQAPQLPSKQRQPHTRAKAQTPAPAPAAE
jgi:hypothetical protein